MSSDSSKVFGIPTTTVALLFCLLQLVLCIYALPHASSDPITVGGVLFSPVTQWLIGTFICIVVVTTILAGIGVYYGIESHIVVYLGVLAAFTVLDFIGFCLFLSYGSGCRTHGGGDHGNEAKYSCGFLNSASLIMSAVFAAFEAFGIVVFLKAWSEAQKEYSRSLMPYLKGLERAASLSPSGPVGPAPKGPGAVGYGTAGRISVGASAPPTLPPVPKGPPSMRPLAPPGPPASRSFISGAPGSMPSASYPAPSPIPTVPPSGVPKSMPCSGRPAMLSQAPTMPPASMPPRVMSAQGLSMQ